MNILFWNINNKDSVVDLIISAVEDEDVDLFIIAEANENIVQDLTYKLEIKNFKPIDVTSERFVVFSKIEGKYLNVLKTKKYYGVLEFIETDREKTLIFFVHLPSQLHQSEKNISFECVNLSNFINYWEKKSETERNLVIGDFNLNPYDDGLIAANGLNAIGDKNKIADKKRKVNENNYKYFYNPMWNFFGDNSTPYGTYYHKASKMLTPFWHLFDQVLLRYEFVQYYKNYEVDIITKVENESLINTKNRIDAKVYSDHLPIIIRLEK